MGEKAGNELLQEAVQYFREQKGFARLARSLWISTAAWAGVVVPSG